MSTTAAIRSFRMMSELVQRMGPYLLIELLLPGGTLIAFILYVSRRGDGPLATVAAPIRVATRNLYAGVQRALLFVLPDAISALLREEDGGERDGLEPLAMGPAQLARHAA